jgi:hypothetical protein
MAGEFRMHWSNFSSGLDVRGRGDITFKPDLTDVESLSDGGYLSIRTWSLFIPRTIEIRSEGGRLTHRYYVAGLSRPYDAEARRWLATELSTTLVRRVGLGAESRTRQILAAGGVAAVLDEIKQLDGDHVRSRYFRELFKAARLDSTSLGQALALAESVIGSDFELSQTLRVAAPGAALERGRSRPTSTPPTTSARLRAAARARDACRSAAPPLGRAICALTAARMSSTSKKGWFCDRHWRRPHSITPAHSCPRSAR